jgi:hypothetical protein
VPAPNQDLVFNVMVFSELRWEVIVRFDDIDGIVDHHCLSFLFIISIKGLCWMDEGDGHESYIISSFTL